MLEWSEEQRREIISIHEMAAKGLMSEAIARADAALARGLEHPVLLNLSALAAEQRGDLDAALKCLDRALQIAPKDLSCLNARGLLLLRLERAEDALANFAQALVLQPDIPFLHVNRANALVMLGEMAAAEAGYRDALARDPAHALALSGLATVASARGDHARATTAARVALEQRPGIPDAEFALAAAQLADDNFDEAERHLKVLLNRGSLSPLDQARARVLLGDALDGSRQYARAFEEYDRANSMFREIYAHRYEGDPSAAEYVRTLIKTLDGTKPSDWVRRAPDRGAVGHVFLLGFPRSGTTLLEMILDGSAQVASLEEKESLLLALREFMGDPADLTRLLDATEAELDVYRDAYWDAVMQQGVPLAGKIFVDKYPLNTLKLPLIARLFPDAKIIFAVRDPRDVVLSCFRRYFKMSAPMYELLELQRAAAYYNAVMHLADRCLKLTNLTVLEVRHEDLVEDFSGQMAAVCRFIGLQWTSVMGDFATRAKTRPQATPSTAQLAQGLNRRTVQHWRNYAEQMKPVLSTLSLWVERFGYEKS